MVKRAMVLSVILLFAVSGCKNKAAALKEAYEESIKVSESLISELGKAGNEEEIAAAFNAWGDSAAKNSLKQKKLMKGGHIRLDDAELLKKMVDAAKKQADAMADIFTKYPNNKRITDAYTKAAQKVADAQRQ